jgi:hypothetical protein
MVGKQHTGYKRLREWLEEYKVHKTLYIKQTSFVLIILSIRKRSLVCGLRIGTIIGIEVVVVVEVWQGMIDVTIIGMIDVIVVIVTVTGTETEIVIEDMGVVGVDSMKKSICWCYFSNMNNF